MKKLLTYIMLLYAINANAQLPTQSPYPNEPTVANNIDKYSFFIDSVTTVNEIIQNFSAANSNITPSQNISLASVNFGVHQLYAKVTDVVGKPSIINVGNFYKEGGNNAYQNVPLLANDINKYSFYIDSVTTVNELVQNFTAASNNSTPSQTISLASVNTGVHQLYAKITDVVGKPSIINVGNFYKEGESKYQNAPPIATNINRYEFYVDSVTNQNIQPLSFTPGNTNTTPSTNIDLTSVFPGTHQLYAKVFDINNIPSIVNVRSFLMEQNYRYQNVAPTAPTIQNMEYFVDTDPGYGLGTAITLTPNTDVQVLSIPISISNLLALGTHYLHVRSKQNPWSIDNAVSFEVGAVVPLNWLYVNAKLQYDKTFVDWATAQEINTSTFEIERSVNGVHFVKIGEQLAAGNSSTTKKYEFVDTKPASGFNYYRIKQLDVNGAFTYSTIVKILNNKNIKEAFIAPNPVVDVVNLIEPKNIFVQSIEIYDRKNALVLFKKVSSEVQLYSLPVSNLAKGNYILKVNYGSTSKSIVFVK